MLKPHAPKLIPALLEALSALEPQVLSYLSLCATDQDKVSANIEGNYQQSRNSKDKNCIYSVLDQKVADLRGRGKEEMANGLLKEFNHWNLDGQVWVVLLLFFGVFFAGTRKC